MRIIRLGEVIVKGKFIQFAEIQKFGQRHVEADGDVMQRRDAGVFCDATDDIVDRGLVESAHGSQFIAGDSPALTQRQDALDQDVGICHTASVFLDVTRKRVDLCTC